MSNHQVAILEEAMAVWHTKEATPYKVEIFVAGDINVARQVCQDWVMAVGQCVTVSPTSYIYSGGEEAGIVVGFINYPRYPKEDPKQLVHQATELAMLLVEGLGQWGATVQSPDSCVWLTRREP